MGVGSRPNWPPHRPKRNHGDNARTDLGQGLLFFALLAKKSTYSKGPRMRGDAMKHLWP